MTLNATVGVMPVPTVMTSVLSAAGGGVAAHPMLAPDAADRLDEGSVVVGEAEETSSSERGGTTS